MHVLTALTERELEILRLVALGYKDADIARDLYIEVSTVKCHLRNIRTKFYLEGDNDARCNLALLAIQLNLLNDLGFFFKPSVAAEETS